MSDHGEKTCPLCAEEMDLTDQQLKPCKCGYQICVWCWHHIMDMAEKDQTEGRCPACRTPYDKEKIVGMTVDRERLASEGTMERKKTQKSKLKSSEGRKQLTSVRVVQRNLVYIVGLPLNLTDEDLLQHKEYFGQYGKVLKVSMSRTATGLIQQFPNNTCSVYITYAKEEEAVRCIQSVHGFILDGKPLKACFGTTKYCHAWLRNVACNNPDCLYLHEVGSQDDSFTKDEIISAHTRSRVQQITGATNTLQHRSGSMLPPPLDAYCSDSFTAKPIAKAPSTTTVSAPKGSPPSGSSGRSTALPAAASWGARVTNQQSLATSAMSNGTSDKQRSTSENGNLAISTAVANSAYGSVSSSNSLKKGTHTLADKSKPGVLKPLQHKIVVDPGSKRPTTPSKDPIISNQLSCLEESSSNSRVIDGTSADEDAFDNTNETAENGPTVSNLSADVAWMGTTTNSRDEDPGIQVTIDTQCDQGSIRQPGNDVQKLIHREQSRKHLPINTDEEADVSQNGIHGTEQDLDWRSHLQSQMQASSMLEVDDLSQFDNKRCDGVEALNHSTYMFNSPSSILATSHRASSSFQTNETSGVINSDSGSLATGGHRLHIPNGINETSISNMEHSLFANEGRNNIQNAEDDIISSFLDFDPWDESSTSPHNFAKLLGQTDNRSSTHQPSSFPTQHNDQSRFSFARHEESNNQAFNSNTYGIYGQLSRNQPIQEFGVSRDMYQEKLGGQQNGFASNYSGGFGHIASSPGFSSYKSPVSRSQVSAPPGFSAPNRLPPPGFSAHERADLPFDIASGTRLLESTSLLRNAYQIPSPSSNLNSAGDIEFMDPAILAVGRGIPHNGMDTTEFDIRSGFSSSLNSFKNEARLQSLAQRSLSTQQLNGFHDPRKVNNFSPSISDPYGISSRLMDQTQGTSLSPFTQLPRQPSPNPLLSNGNWDKWTETHNSNTLGMSQLLRNERIGFNDSLYSRFEEPNFRRPGPGDPYNRTYGI